MCPNLPESISYSDVGGNKTDYSPAVNTNTDRLGTEMDTALVNIAMMTRTVNRGWIRFSTDGYGVPTLTSWNACWRGNTSAQPVVARTGIGVLTATFATSVLDEQALSHTTNIQLVQAASETIPLIFVSSASANVITIKTFDNSFAAKDGYNNIINVIFI
jgi:hypothetical protein